MKAALTRRQGALIGSGGAALLAMAAAAYAFRAELGFWQEAALTTPAPIASPTAPPREAAPERAAPTAPAAPARGGGTAETPRPAPEPPRFDVVRVGARGTAVVAGRAAPGAEVVLYADGDRELGRARADARGEWVILPLDPLPAGARELSLRARLAGVDMPGSDTVVVMVPEPAPATAPVLARPADPPAIATGPLAVLLPPPAASAAPRLLQGPQPAPPAPEAARLGLSAVEYDELGDIRFSGTAPPGAAVRLYVGERHAGDARADQAGRWTLRPTEPPPVGRNTLRLDQLASAGGMVAARLELPFQRDRVPDGAFQSQRVIVQPGNNLWRIARQTYGQGVRYAVIYQANRDQIRDPARIYPGQIFALPEASEGPRTPSASSRSR